MTAGGADRLEDRRGDTRGRSGPKKRAGLGIAVSIFCAVSAAAIFWQALPAGDDPLGMRGGRGDPDTVMREAQGLFQSADTPEEHARVQRLAKTVLARDPLNARAASLLAVSWERQGERNRASAMMTAAGELSRRDSLIDAWIFDDASRRRDYKEAYRRADAMLRRDPELSRALFLRMMALLADPGAVDPLGERLATRPPWRSEFLNAVYTQVPNPSAAFPLLSAMNKAGGGPTTGELSPYLERLTGAGRFEEAYLNWILFLPASEISRITTVFDGEFNGWSTARPFGWTIGGGVGGAAEIAEISEGRKALHVDANGFDRNLFANQLLLLTPGRYRFSGEILNRADETAGRVFWSLNCVNGASLLKIPSIATGGEWRAFTAEFEAPAGCQAQHLSLASEGGDQRATVDVWYDKIRIDAAGEAGR